MTTVSGSLTALGVSSVHTSGKQIETVTISIDGTYSATVEFQRAVNRGQTAWEVIDRFSTDNATQTRVYTTQPYDVFRVEVVAFTSGTVNYSISDSDAVVREFRDADGNTLLVLKQSGVSIPGALAITGDIATVGDIATDGVVSADKLTLDEYTVATAPETVVAGQLIYVSDGNAGEATVAIGDGTTWLNLVAGTEISAT